ncbi:MAG: WecB/TagA/CpsF family glycosyltransferase [Lachnospiraceae bacterium]|nr:WecB/TagA/CpsF family glycosyltransferase [Lachnospiraceae bacterium]
MQASVKVMDIDIDMMTKDIFIQKMNEYLSDEKLEVILFASTELLDLAVEDESYCNLISQADLILPGEEALLSAHHVDILEAGGMVVSCKSLGVMLENLWQRDQSLYIIGKNDKEVELLKSWCQRMQPELKMAGARAYDPEMEDAALVNEINNQTPGILLVDLETGLQEQWIMEHLPLLHARLCVAVGGVVGLILAEEKEIPEWVKKLHLESLYEKLVKEQAVKKDVQARIFRKKVVQYNNQLEENDDEKKDDYI